MQYLSKFEALIICFLLASFFVSSLYFFDRKKQLKLSRNHPEVIKKRFISILIVCIISPIALLIYYYIRNVFENNSFNFFLNIMGITYKNIIIGTVIGLLLVLEIYFGPLVVMYYQKELIFQNENYKYIQMTLIEIRNFIVGPISEEFIFRSCMVSACCLAEISNKVMIFTLPLFFGLAHVHHAYEYYMQNKNQEGALIQALLGTGFQFLYTTVFGWFSTYLILRTGNILSPICAHALCNILDFPDVNSVFAATGKSRVTYMACYVIGLIVFIINMCFVSKTSLIQSFFWN